MQGLPVLNKALRAAAIGFEPWQEYRLGVLATPWFMNLVLLPRDQAGFAGRVGQKRLVSLPAGQVEFIVGFEEALGWLLSCSLFSPVFEFHDQEAALETARAALTGVLDGAEQTGAEQTGTSKSQMWGIRPDRLPGQELEQKDENAPGGLARPVSRRNFLRGASSTKLSPSGLVAPGLGSKEIP